MERWEISDAALELIKEFEGLRLEAYLDPVGIDYRIWLHQ